MYKIIASLGLAAGVTLASALPTWACACCSRPLTLSRDTVTIQALSALKNVHFRGHLQEHFVEDMPDMESHRLFLGGTFTGSALNLQVQRNRQMQGRLRLEPTGQIEHQRTSLDYVFSQQQLEALKIAQEIPVYHRIVIPMKVLEAPGSLLPQSSQVIKAELSLHTHSNACLELDQLATQATRWSLVLIRRDQHKISTQIMVGELR